MAFEPLDMPRYALSLSEEPWQATTGAAAACGAAPQLRGFHGHGQEPAIMQRRSGPPVPRKLVGSAAWQQDALPMKVAPSPPPTADALGGRPLPAAAPGASKVSSQVYYEKEDVMLGRSPSYGAGTCAPQSPMNACRFSVTRASNQDWFEKEEVKLGGFPSSGAGPFAPQLPNDSFGFSATRICNQDYFEEEEEDGTLGVSPCVGVGTREPQPPNGSFRFSANPAGGQAYKQEGVKPGGSPFAAAGPCAPQAPKEGSFAKKGRPCKAKRDRYHKLIFSLIEEYKIDPAGFSLESSRVALPPSLMQTKAEREKLLSIVTRLARTGQAPGGHADLVPAPTTTPAAATATNEHTDFVGSTASPWPGRVILSF